MAVVSCYLNSLKYLTYETKMQFRKQSRNSYSASTIQTAILYSNLYLSLCGAREGCLWSVWACWCGCYMKESLIISFVLSQKYLDLISLTVNTPLVVGWVPCASQLRSQKWSSIYLCLCVCGATHVSMCCNFVLACMVVHLSMLLSAAYSKFPYIMFSIIWDTSDIWG